MRGMERRIGALEKTRGNTTRLVWITYKDGGILSSKGLFPDEASCRLARGLSDKDCLIGWEKDEDVIIYRIPDNGRDTLGAGACGGTGVPEDRTGGFAGRDFK